MFSSTPSSGTWFPSCVIQFLGGHERTSTNPDLENWHQGTAEVLLGELESTGYTYNSMGEKLLLGAEIQDSCIPKLHPNIGNSSQNLGKCISLYNIQSASQAVQVLFQATWRLLVVFITFIVLEERAWDRESDLF